MSTQAHDDPPAVWSAQQAEDSKTHLPHCPTCICYGPEGPVYQEQPKIPANRQEAA